MRILKADEIRTILRAEWRDLTQIWMFDQNYACISKIELEDIISIIWQKMKKSGEKLDCDEEALFLHAAVKKYWAQMSTVNVALAFGEVAGVMFNAWPSIHNQNISIADDRTVLLVEPQTKEIWKANRKDDRPYWMRF